ncbi:MAG: HlyD family type I secretion periplasmic adaptor subunit [Alphaproteobacteria bacterium]|nr:HlyD family type I secretion periplasmic adaptor subunit [Alphaproteobacteria bacterium]
MTTAAATSPGAPHRTTSVVGEGAPARLPAVQPSLSLVPWIVAGSVLIAVTFVGVGGWAAIAPLNSAAIAVGKVSVEGDRKVVQHLEGGIVQQVLVKDGDKVEPGQVLIQLDDTRARVELQAISGQITSIEAGIARLEAERDGRTEPRFPRNLQEKAKASPEISEIVETQKNLFASRKAASENRIGMLRQRIAQAREEIRGTEAVMGGQARQIAIIRDELVGLRQLFEKGNITRQRLLALEREQAALEGQRGDHIATIARTQQKIAEAEIAVIDTSNQRVNDAIAELEKLQTQLAVLVERRAAAEDIVKRLDVRAPRSGIVVGLAVNSTGAVIAPRERLMDIVPQDEALVVEARVRPLDIDVVHEGLPAEVRLSAYTARRTPTVPGKVKSISADLVTDQKTGEGYYRAIIELAPGALDKIEEVALYPGMPVEVMIVTGERTALEYLAQPILASINRSLRED